MSQNVGTLAAQVSERARDVNQTGTTQANVILLLSFAQQVINGVLGHITEIDSLTPNKRQVIFTIFGNLPNSVRVQAVRDSSGRDLVPFGEFAGLSQIDTAWPSRMGSAPRSYALCGRDLLILYPGVDFAPPTFSVVSTALTVPLTLPTQTTQLTLDDDDAILDLTEVLLLLKARDLPDCRKIVERFKTRMQNLSSEPK